MYIWINDIEVYTIEIITINLRMTLHGGCYNVRFSCDIWVKYEKQGFAIFFFFLQRCKLTKKKKTERKIYNYCLQKL